MQLRSEQTPQFRRGFRLQWEEVQNSYVILYPEGMVKLNESAAAILLLVDSERTLADIIAELSARFPDVPELGADVTEFFVNAYKQKWVLFRG